MQWSDAPRGATNGGLATLEAALRKDLEVLAYPSREWIPEHRTQEGRPVLDVLVIGGGQSGLAAAWGLMRERVTRLLVVDDSAPGKAGPWTTFARMTTLRTPKHLTGADLNLPNLTFRRWYEAQLGPDSWASLGFIPKEAWADYLSWFRTVLHIPVRHQTQAGALRWCEADRCFEIPLTQEGRVETVFVRKVVLATGIDGSGRWSAPPQVEALPKSLWAHTHEEIDFASLRGKSIGVLGAGASAFDNASVALEQGAAAVHLFFRRKTLPNVNPYRWAEFVGFLRHHADMSDANRWRFVRRIIEMGQLPPKDTFERAKRHAHFHLHPNSGWRQVEARGEKVVVRTETEEHVFDFLIMGCGFVTDLSARPELAQVFPHVALWQDRFTPPAAETHADLLRHPYLGPGFELQEKVPGEAPWLRGLFNYTFGCLLSLGFGGASISGMKYSLPRLVGGVTGQLYADDLELHFRSFSEYAQTEFDV